MASEDIAIDPDLLEEDGAVSEDYDTPSDGESSELEDNDDEDAYIDEDEEAEDEAPTRPVEDDAIFK